MITNVIKSGHIEKLDVLVSEEEVILNSCRYHVY